MAIPAWLWITSPLKLALWCFARAATWGGTAFLWKRHRRARQHFWVRLLVLNAVSIGILVGVFFWLHHRVVQ
ncbi:MAG: hypothetical protein HY737_05960 [Candidatus Omnitrophica bacterium]|nr:hypothetical protein [Candidatus Omnitrophota bacterium]